MSLKDELKKADSETGNSEANNTELATRGDYSVANVMADLGDFGESEELEEQGSGTAWLDFYHPLKRSSAELMASMPGIQIGEPYYSRSGYEKLGDTRIQLLGKIHQCYAKFDGSGEMIATSADKQPFPYKEYVIAVINIFEGDTVFPGIAQLKGPKCRMVHDLKSAVKATEADSWARGDKVREQLMKAPPAFRIAGTLQMIKKTSVKVDAEGNRQSFDYHIATAKCSPLTLDEMSTLQAAMKDEAYGKLAAAAVEQFDRKVQEVKLLSK